MTTRQLLPFTVLVATIPACAPPPEDTGARHEQDPVPVTVAPLLAVTVNRTVPVVGSLDPYKEVTLAPKVDGRVQRVRHDVGDVVFPGDVLLELDPEEHLTEVRIARAKLNFELARLDRATYPDATFDPDSVSAVISARAELELAKAERERIKAQRMKGVGSEQDVQTAETKVQVAESRVRIARADVNATLANAEGMKSSLDKAEQHLRDTVLRAPVPEEWAAWAAAVGPGFTPFRFRVASRMVWEGEMVRAMPEKNAFRLVIDHALKLRAAVPEKYAPEVLPGQPVEVRVEAYPDRTFAGVVARVSPTVDALNRTFQVEIVVANCDPRWRIKAGSFAKAEIRVRTDAGVATVPPEAVVSFAGVTKVFVVDGDKAKAIEVQLGQRDKEWVEVIGKLPPNAQVITSGFSQLVDGSPIRTRDGAK